jgi:hypothetical protein
MMAGRQAARTSGRADRTHSRMQVFLLTCLPDCKNARRQECKKARKRERLQSNYPARLMYGLINGMKE